MPSYTEDDQPQCVTELLQTSFMQAPPKEVLDQIIVDFLRRTSNDALKLVVCACCGREANGNESTLLSLSTIPNRNLLKPHEAHPAHDLYDGILLEPAGIDLRTKQASFCEECLNRLKIGKLPPLALANNMWIGAVPLELSVLTLAERLLISMYFPTAYVFKLYPKHAGSASWDPSQLYDGMKGNVSTYPLDPALVADMIDGKLFPMPPKILCCTVAVTFITPSGQHMKGLPSHLRVRRIKVYEALCWLKKNNPLYANITISGERLHLLPEDGIPTEISQNVRESNDVNAVIREHEGYVPVDTGEATESAMEDDLIVLSSGKKHSKSSFCLRISKILKEMF